MQIAATTKDPPLAAFPTAESQTVEPGGPLPYGLPPVPPQLHPTPAAPSDAVGITVPEPANYSQTYGESSVESLAQARISFSDLLAFLHKTPGRKMDIADGFTSSYLTSAGHGLDTEQSLSISPKMLRPSLDRKITPALSSSLRSPMSSSSATSPDLDTPRANQGNTFTSRDGKVDGWAWLNTSTMPGSSVDQASKCELHSDASRMASPLGYDLDGDTDSDEKNEESLHDARARSDPIPEATARNGKIWGMKVETYNALSAADRKRVRNRLSARMLRARKKSEYCRLCEYSTSAGQVSTLETQLTRKDRHLEATMKEIRHIRSEVASLRAQLVILQRTLVDKCH